MTDTARPSSRLLGHELRAARERAGRTAEWAADRAGFSPSKMSRLEHGLSGVSVDDLITLIRVYRVPAAEGDRLQELCRAAADGRTMLSVAHDPQLTELLYWAPYTVPPALRTEALARAVMNKLRRIRHLTGSAIKGEIVADRDLQARLRGQPLHSRAVLLDPPQVTCVLDEAVLTRRRGATSVMTGQLDQLETLASLDGLELRILPLDADGPAIDTAFTLLGYADETVDTVQITMPAGVTEITDEQQVTDFRYVFEDLLAAAADVEESRALIKRAADRWAG